MCSVLHCRSDLQGTLVLWAKGAHASFQPGLGAHLYARLGSVVVDCTVSLSYCT
jgi:hypothetical protein